MNAFTVLGNWDIIMTFDLGLKLIIMSFEPITNCYLEKP